MNRCSLYWENILFLAATHLLGIAAVVHAALVSFSPWTALLAAGWLGLCMLSTTGGYHRLFAHRTYRAAWPLRLFYLVFGAASFEGPVLRWAAEHRLHHAATDEEDDPHSIKKGFWWAHIGWLFYRTESGRIPPTPDLAADPLIRFQDRFYLPLAILAGLALPMALAA
ncbi:MAG TPA: acyl-CoA desaturase, partial [Planctomycetota bacterium]|nr:acyl-CoA desaturase [Planctomycetota bacterium]